MDDTPASIASSAPLSAAEKRRLKLDQLKNQKATLEARIAKLNAAASKETRRIDTRKKILVGAVVLAEAAHDPKIAEWLRGQLERGLVADRDRALFDLPPKSTPAPAEGDL